MNKLTFTRRELEKKVEKALENACAYHALHNWKLCFVYYNEAQAWLEMLEDLDVWYDEGDTINEHVQAMLDIMRETKFSVTVSA